MFEVIKSKTKPDRDYPDRYYPLMLFQQVLDGSLYDCFKYQYHDEYIGGVMNERYVKEVDRAPCVRTGLNLMRSVVEESVSFLFGEDRFPDVICEDDKVKQFIDDLIVDAHLVNVMQEAALKGSIGSVAIQVRVLKDRFFPLVHYTTYLTPEFDPQEPDVIIKITEKKKVLGRDLAAAGYDIDPMMHGTQFWFQRIWDSVSELWFDPLPIEPLKARNARGKRDPAEPVRMTVDKKRSLRHNLGIVPWIWIRNLPHGPNEVDGACTFEPALANAVQIDYMLSRADRALKYNADPLTVVKTRNPGDMQDFVKAEGNALVLGIEGDAKILEITGDAAHSIIDTVKELKDEALHSIHGNRANPDKLAISQSSVAQRMLYLPMVQLASALRRTYGDMGIIPLIQMMLKIGSKMPIKLRGKMQSVAKPDVPLLLDWADWFPATPADVQTEITALAAGVAGGVVSRETAVRQLSRFFDYPGTVEDEVKRVEQDIDKQTEVIGEQAKAEADAQPKPVVKSVPK